MTQPLYIAHFTNPGYCPWVVKYSIYERNLSSNFCSFTFKSMKWDSKRWLDSFYILARPFSSPHASVRATAYHNTWHFKENVFKIQNLPISKCWKQLLMKCKGIVYRRRVFSLDSTFKLIFTKKFSTWDKMLHLILLVGMNSPRKSCWKA